MPHDDSPPHQRLSAWFPPHESTPEIEAYDRMIGAMRGFLDAVAGARPDEAALTDLTRDLEAWRERLGGFAVEEDRQIFGRLVGRRGRGQTMIPPLSMTETPEGEVIGRVEFGRYFLGAGGAAHGGSLSVVFDEVLGRAASGPERRMVRTAYLHVNYRALTPLDKPLEVRGWVDRLEGRKLFVRGELRDGDTLCADAEALFITLQPGQR